MLVYNSILAYKLMLACSNKIFERNTIAFVYEISLVEGGRKKEPNWKKINQEESEVV